MKNRIPTIAVLTTSIERANRIAQIIEAFFNDHNIMVCLVVISNLNQRDWKSFTAVLIVDSDTINKCSSTTYLQDVIQDLHENYLLLFPTRVRYKFFENLQVDHYEIFEDSKELFEFFKRNLEKRNNGVKERK